MVQSSSLASRGKAPRSSSASPRPCHRAEASRMRLVSGIAIAALVLLLPACELKRPGRAKTPAAPQPAAAKAEPPAAPSPSEPLSVPQTQVHLPPPQPINPEALATPPVNNPSEAAAPRQAHRTPRPKPGSS